MKLIVRRYVFDQKVFKTRQQILRILRTTRPRSLARHRKGGDDCGRTSHNFAQLSRCPAFLTHKKLTTRTMANSNLHRGTPAHLNQNEGFEGFEGFVTITCVERKKLEDSFVNNRTDAFVAFAVFAVFVLLDQSSAIGNHNRPENQDWGFSRLKDPVTAMHDGALSLANAVRTKSENRSARWSAAARAWLSSSAVNLTVICSVLVTCSSSICTPVFTLADVQFSQFGKKYF
jgi:hypothetical protein